MTINEDGSVSFTLTKDQYEQYQSWRKNLPEIDTATIGGAFEFVFIPTGVGTIELVRRVDSKSIDLTDYLNW